jgi:hypothetical protein
MIMKRSQVKGGHRLFLGTSVTGHLDKPLDTKTPISLVINKTNNIGILKIIYFLIITL